MQRLADNSFRFSPKDLIAFLEGDFAAWCERHQAEASRTSPAFTPDAKDEEMALVIRRGLEHEAAHLATLRSRELALVEIGRNSGEYDAHAATLTAMHAGAPIIFQGELRAAQWMGISDFLHRAPGA